MQPRPSHVAVILFALAAVLAFVSHWTSANTSLYFILGLLAAGLAFQAAEAHVPKR